MNPNKLKRAGISDLSALATEMALASTPYITALMRFFWSSREVYNSNRYLTMIRNKNNNEKAMT